MSINVIFIVIFLFLTDDKITSSNIIKIYIFAYIIFYFFV